MSIATTDSIGKFCSKNILYGTVNSTQIPNKKKEGTGVDRDGDDLKGGEITNFSLFDKKKAIRFFDRWEGGTE